MPEETEKAAWRSRLLAARATLTPARLAAAAEQITAHVLDRLSDAAQIAAYVPIDREPGPLDLLDALRERGTMVLLPVVRPNRELDWAPYAGPERLTSARWGLREPVDYPVVRRSPAAGRGGSRAAGGASGAGCGESSAREAAHAVDSGRAPPARGTPAGGQRRWRTDEDGPAARRTGWPAADVQPTGRPGSSPVEQDEPTTGRPAGSPPTWPPTWAGLPAGRGSPHGQSGRGASVSALSYRVEAILVPALAADHGGIRLGRGAGYYDRALARVPAWVPVVALLHDGELVPRLPADSWDRPVTAAVTPGDGWTNLPLVSHHGS